MSSGSSENVTLVGTETVTRTFTNTPDTDCPPCTETCDGSLIIYKYEAGTTIPLEGAIFELYNITTGDFYGRKATDANGMVSWENLEPGVYEAIPICTHNFVKNYISSSSSSAKISANDEYLFALGSFSNCRASSMASRVSAFGMRGLMAYSIYHIMSSSTVTPFCAKFFILANFWRGIIGRGGCFPRDFLARMLAFFLKFRPPFCPSGRPTR